MLFLQPMPMDDVAAANRPVAAEISHAEGARDSRARVERDAVGASTRHARQPVAQPGRGFTARGAGNPGR